MLLAAEQAARPLVVQLRPRRRGLWAVVGVWWRYEGRPAAGAGDAWAGPTFGDLRPEQGDVRHGGKRTARSSRIRAIGVWSAQRWLHPFIPLIFLFPFSRSPRHSHLLSRGILIQISICDVWLWFGMAVGEAFHSCTPIYVLCQVVLAQHISWIRTTRRSSGYVVYE